MYDDDIRQVGYSDELHVLADAPAAHRHGPGPAGPRHGRHRGPPRGRREPPLRVRHGEDGPAAALQPGAKDGLTWRRRSRQRRPTAKRPGRRRPRPDLRRDRRRRRPQRPGQRRLPGQGRAQDADPRAAARSSAARRSPRSCCPGFSFTTFSYALSLLRPDIIHELELTKHGFMPLLMSSTFAPMENGDYLLARARTTTRTSRRSPGTASTTPTPTSSTRTTWSRSARRIKPLLDAAPPDLFSDDPEELLALASTRLALPADGQARPAQRRSGC